MKNRIFFAFVFMPAVIIAPAAMTSPMRNDDSTPEIQIGIQRILDNVNSPHVTPGAVIASPSRQDPDYDFHWTRDAGLTMMTLLEQLPRSPQLGATIRQWALFEKNLQSKLISRGQSLGEPKFEVNGDVYAGPWGRPQNDGPAIRSLAFLRAYGRPDPLVEADLDFLRSHWQDPNFDLWEEVKGHHFFTRYSQMAAFYLAARVYTNADPARAQAYAMEGQKVENSLSAFIDGSRLQIVPTLKGSQGVQKPTGLDISTLLAPLYFGAGTRWSISQSEVMATALQIEQAFKNLYPINSRYPNLAPAIGRYPEDVYDGTGFSQGHAWFLATFGMGEYYCALVEDFSRRRLIRVDALNVNFLRAAAPTAGLVPRTNLTSRQPEFQTVLQGLQDKGRSFLQRALFHGGSDRHYSEQFDRDSGYRRGARDLTWSYASSVRAFQRCMNSERALDQIRLAP